MLARSLEMLPEAEIESTFSDCECGAIPAIGEPYGVDVVVDPALIHQPDVYFESGDHQHLIHMNGEVFRQLMENVPTRTRQPPPLTARSTRPERRLLRAGVWFSLARLVFASRPPVRADSCERPPGEVSERSKEHAWKVCVR